MSGKLTPKRARFVAGILIHGNGALAAREAGFEPASAHVTASRLLRERKIAAAIADGRARLALKYEVTAERTLRTLAEIAYGDIADLVDEDGQTLPVQRMPAAARTMIGGLEVETTEGPGRVRTVTHKVKLADRIRAAELLGKYHKLFGGDGGFGATVEVPGGLPDDSTIRIVLVKP